MRSRYLHELTTPEAEAYLQRGSDIALLPVGCVEMHGPHQPIGTDTFLARAFALRLAEINDGLVLPDVCYTWAGATDGFVGSVSIDPGMTQALVETILLKAHRMGFKRIAVVNVHGPSRFVLGLATRRVFETHGLAAAHVEAYSPFTEEAAELFAGERAKAKEACLVLAALEILGMSDLYREADMAYEDEAPPEPETYWGMRPATVGFFMQDPRQHACPSKHISLELGREFYRLQLEAMAGLFDKLSEYQKIASDQANKGSWRPPG